MFRHKIGTIRKCFYFNDCHTKEIHDGLKWKEEWAHYQGNIICESHWRKLVRNPRRPKGYNKKYQVKSKKINHPRRIRFLGKRIILGFFPRTGFCSLCTNNIHNGSCKKTDRHHWFYLSIMPWACTVELCNSCHHNKNLNEQVF